GPRTRTEQRGEIGVVQDGKGVGPDILLLFDGEAVCRQRQKPPCGNLAFSDRQLGKTLQQLVNKEPAFKPGTPSGRERRKYGRFHFGRPRRGERARWIGLGGWGFFHPARQRSNGRCRRCPAVPNRRNGLRSSDPQGFAAPSVGADQRGRIKREWGCNLREAGAAERVP